MCMYVCARVRVYDGDCKSHGVKERVCVLRMCSRIILLILCTHVIMYALPLSHTHSLSFSLTHKVRVRAQICTRALCPVWPQSGLLIHEEQEQEQEVAVAAAAAAAAEEEEEEEGEEGEGEEEREEAYVR